MSNVYQMQPKSDLSTPQGPIDGGGEPPYDGGMESRIAKLEDFAQDTRERMVRVETKLDHIEKEVSQTKWWLIGSTLTIILTVIATVVGTGIGIQQMTVSSFQAASQQAQPAQPPIIINVPQPAAQPPAQR